MPPSAQPSALALLGPLEAYDLTLWLGSEQAAARALKVSQPSVNRSCKRLWKALDLPKPREIRQHPTLLLQRDSFLLDRLRRINQQLRLTDRKTLRFQSDQRLSRPQQNLLEEQGWAIGYSGLWRPEQITLLLQKHVVDIWLPLKSSTPLTRRQITTSPTTLLHHHVDLHRQDRIGMRHQ